MILLQAVPLPPADFQPDVSLWSVCAWGALNPVMMAVSFQLGRHADQPAKLGIAAFAGAIAGVAVLWLAARMGLSFATDVARGAAGVFVVSLLCGTGWAWLGRRRGS
jgi:hypothetical protein